MNHSKIPFALPFKFVRSTPTPGIHFDDSWACEQVKSFETKAIYRQKWKRTDTTPLQVESSINPDTLKIYNSLGVQVKAIPWAAVYAGINYTIYQATFDISDLPEGVYYAYHRVTAGAIEWKYITEAIHSKDSWPNTLLISYKNSFNDFDVAWTTGIEMKFRCEAGIMDFDPKRERSDYINQVYDTTTLKATPYREFVLYIGTAPGVAPYITDILNRIFCCNYIDIQGMLFQAKSGAEGKTNRVKGYPLVGWSQDIVPAKNAQSLEDSDTTPLAPGLVSAYNIETTFFGPGSLVPVIDVEEQS